MIRVLDFMTGKILLINTSMLRSYALESASLRLDKKALLHQRSLA
jgi:hypothetical protein